MRCRKPYYPSRFPAPCLSCAGSARRDTSRWVLPSEGTPKVSSQSLFPSQFGQLGRDNRVRLYESSQVAYFPGCYSVGLDNVRRDVLELIPWAERARPVLEETSFLLGASRGILEPVHQRYVSSHSTVSASAASNIARPCAEPAMGSRRRGMPYAASAAFMPVAWEYGITASSRA